MTAQEFIDLSTKLFKDLKVWVAAAGEDGNLSPADLETIRAATEIVERVTLREAAAAPDPTGGPIIL
jgi:hypothetical protein